jgi:hypothetical protein
MQRIRLLLTNSLSIPLVMLLLLPAAAHGQTGARVAFSVSPNEFAAGQNSSAVLSVSCVSAMPLTVSPGDSFTFFVDASAATVTSVKMPIQVTSSNLSAVDFGVGLTSNQVVITYNGQAKTFSYGDALSVEAAFTARAQIGTGKVSFSSRLTGSVNGNLPYTMFSIVDFANGGVTTVAHDATLSGNGTGASPLGVAVPLILAGKVDTVLTVRSMGTNNGGAAAFQASDAPPGLGNTGGLGLGAFGGSGDRAGDAINALGGQGITKQGGGGVFARGGQSFAGDGGGGVLGAGGSSAGGHGGDGVDAFGGQGIGAGHQGGDGILVGAGTSVNGAVNGRAGTFNGDVQVNGNLSKSSGSFKIDHPLDPANKYLYHSFVESPDMKNIYDGNITTDEAGEATVTLPEWFQALNKDFRYQLTVIGQFAQATISSKISGNRFTIRTSAPNVEVSWQVTGVRQDAWANAHRIPVEEDKSDQERGHYLHPELFNQPEEKGVEWARHPELMRQMKEKGEQMSQTAQSRNQ